MTVQELIAALQQMPGELEVRYWDTSVEDEIAFKAPIPIQEVVAPPSAYSQRSVVIR